MCLAPLVQSIPVTALVGRPTGRDAKTAACDEVRKRGRKVPAPKEKSVQTLRRHRKARKIPNNKRPAAFLERRRSIHSPSLLIRADCKLGLNHLQIHESGYYVCIFKARRLGISAGGGPLPLGTAICRGEALRKPVLHANFTKFHTSADCR